MVQFMSLDLSSNRGKPSCGFFALSEVNSKCSVIFHCKLAPFGRAGEHDRDTLGGEKELSSIVKNSLPYTVLFSLISFNHHIVSLPLPSSHLFPPVLNLTILDPIHYRLILSNLDHPDPTMVWHRGSKEIAGKKHPRCAFSLMSLGTRNKGYVHQKPHHLYGNMVLIGGIKTLHRGIAHMVCLESTCRDQ